MRCPEGKRVPYVQRFPQEKSEILPKEEIIKLVESTEREKIKNIKRGNKKETG